ncbi:TPA: TGS domain-containing protein [Klebsiella pneumoniae]
MSEALITESEPLTFTLPDGSLKLVRKGTTLQNVAESIDSSVAKNAVYAEIDGQYIDLIEAVQKSGTLRSRSCAEQNEGLAYTTRVNCAETTITLCADSISALNVRYVKYAQETIL